MEKVTQTSQVLKHMENHKGITSMEAFKLYGVTRLSSIIFCLRKTHNIDSETIEKKNRYGGVSRFSMYKLMD